MTTETNCFKINTSSSNSTAALAWFAAGYLPYPIIKGEKFPRTKVNEWLENLSEARIEQHWQEHPKDDVALYCINGLVVLDADSVESQSAIEKLEASHGLHSKLRVQTKKGVHYYYRQNQILQVGQVGHSTEVHPERIDIRCGRSYIIAPPSTDKHLLVAEIVPFDSLVEITQAFADDLNNHNGSRVEQVKQTAALALSRKQKHGSLTNELDQKLTVIRALIAHLDPDIGYTDWISVLMAIHNETGGSKEGFGLADEWSSAGEKYKGYKEIESKWKSFNQDRGSAVTIGTIRHLLQIQGLDSNQILRNANVITRVMNGQVKVSNLVGLVQPLEFRDFPHQATRVGAQFPATVENFEHLIKGYGVSVRYNEITKKTVIDIPFLEVSIDNADNVKRSRIQALCALNNFSVGIVDNLCGALADLHRYNPARDWITSLPWDGVDRLEAFYATVIAADDFPQDFKKILMKRWMISAVAAVFMPQGFRCRGVLTFSGKQGLGKTSWVNSLISDARLRNEVVLTGHSLDASNKDSKMTAIQNWIVELGEIESTFKSDLPALKSFITNDLDTFRRPYAAADSTFPRRTIFFASVNDANFLNDITGNSRWWTIPVEGVNHQHGLDMQQVFAQIKEECYDKEEGWWLTPEEEAQLTELNKDAEVISPVRELAVAYLNSAKGRDTNFLTATRFLQMLEIEKPSNAQIKEVHIVLTGILGKKRKTSGLQGWDVPMVNI
jgi:predicted P-loop ATPase